MESKTLALLTAILMVTMMTGVVQAATITYVGDQIDVESDDDNPAIGWRNTTPAKPLDIDGDTFVVTQTTSVGRELGGITFDTAVIPEPSALALLGLGIAGLSLRRRRK